MKLWKRNAVVAAIVLFVCVAVYLNWSYQQDETDVDAGKTLGQAALVGAHTSDPLLLGSPAPAESAAPNETAKTSTGYFSTARLNRQQARDSALGMLQDTLNSDASEEAAKADAGAAIETLAASTVSEAQIENLVIAKGYTDCVAFISEGGVSVVVSSAGEGLQETDVARIAEIVMDETGVPASQIKIIGAEG